MKEGALTAPLLLLDFLWHVPGVANLLEDYIHGLLAGKNFVDRNLQLAGDFTGDFTNNSHFVLHKVNMVLEVFVVLFAGEEVTLAILLRRATNHDVTSAAIVPILNPKLITGEEGNGPATRTGAPTLHRGLDGHVPLAGQVGVVRHVSFPSLSLCNCYIPPDFPCQSEKCDRDKKKRPESPSLLRQ